jgi:mRNA-degrading endonuclease toxin of MazEF toxin-antitoxin module
MPSYGDIVMVAGGSYTSKPRPVLVFQDMGINTGDSLLVIPFTSEENKDIETRVSVMPTDDNGLDRFCYLEVEKLSAIKKLYVSHSIGRLEPSTLEAVKHVASSLLMLSVS